MTTELADGRQENGSTQMSALENGGPATSTIPETCGWHSLGPVTDHHIETDSLLIECGHAAVRISPEKSGAIRVRLSQSGIFGRDHSWAVVQDATDAPAWQFEEEDEFLYLITKAVRVRIRKTPCRLSFLGPDSKVIAAEDAGKGMSWDGEEVRCWMRLAAEDHFFGLGERGSPLDKRGQVVVDWNHDAAAHEPWTDPLYQSHPFVLALNQGKSYGLFFDNTYRATFDMGKTSTETFSFGAVGGEMNYYFIPGPAPADVVRRYAQLVGSAPLPPRWALGYQQCRFSYESAKRVREIAKRLREHRIPCDTIYLDIDYMDGFRCFTWHKKNFANPGRLMRDLAKLGYRAVVIIDPGIKVEPGYEVYDEGLAGDHYCYDKGGKPYVGRVWPGNTVFPDFTREAARRWWGTLYKGLIKDGVVGFWNDMNEPADFTDASGTIPMTVRFDNDGEVTDHREAHNVYGMQMARATFEGLRQLRPTERPFVLTRAGYSGVQRYAAVWTGDNLSSWEHLRMSIPMLLNMGLSGITFSGADIGGFREHPSAELYTRWLQLGIFYPLCRTHTVGGKEQDPTAFGKKHEAINRRAIELRYRLLPYIYTELQETSRTGLPMLRPLLLDFPSYDGIYGSNHAFMFGRQIFVAPVVQEHAEFRRVHLPPGDWFDFEDATPRVGDTELDLPVTMDTIPMFVRSGAVIPMRDVVQYVDEKPLKTLTLNIYPGSGGGSYYNDDGLSYDYEKGASVLEEYKVDEAGTATNFRLADRSGAEEFAPPVYLLAFKGRNRAPKSVTRTSSSPTEGEAREAIPTTKTKPTQSGTSPGWYFDKASQTVWVRLPKLSAGDSVVLSPQERSKKGKPKRSGG